MTLRREDIARAMYVGTKEVFMKNLKNMPEQEWKRACTVKTSDKAQETYDSVGNLKPAHEKLEEGSVEYGKIEQAYKTTIVNKTWANGLKVTMEAKEDEQWKVIPEAKVNELARTITQLRERKVAEVWDNTEVDTGGDGVVYASNSHPLLHSASTNDNLATGELTFENYDTCVKMFNDWKSHWGEVFPTSPDKILMHRNYQTKFQALLQSNLVPFESSNTKNTIPQLKAVWNRYISELPVYFLDSTIDTAVFQKRKGLTSEYDYDKRFTFNFYFNVHERYETGMINPGYGFVKLTGAS